MIRKLSPFVLLCAFAGVGALISNTCKSEIASTGPEPDFIMVGSTPGDSIIKSRLGIPVEKTVDFIRWNLAFTPRHARGNTFFLSLRFGEGQPNTLGFTGGGESLSLEGEYTISNDSIGEIYHLKMDEHPGITLSMVKLNDNLFHLLTPSGRLMVGNGGWSYTLNRKEPIADVSAGLPATRNPSLMVNDTARQMIFDGRTPCLEFAEENKLSVASGCFKLKWRLILDRDPKTHLPATYRIKRTDSREKDIVGTWTIVKGIPSNPDALIYRLDPDQPEKSVPLLAGDENVLFLLKKNNQLFVGNSDFSFTLNRKLD